VVLRWRTVISYSPLFLAPPAQLRLARRYDGEIIGGAERGSPRVVSFAGWDRVRVGHDALIVQCVVPSPGPSIRQRRVGTFRYEMPPFSRGISQMPHVPWYRRKDYKHIRSIMDDADQFPETFDEWEKTAKRRLASAAAAGVTIQPVTIDPAEFLAYCKSQNFSARGDRERNMFARASAKHLKKAASDQA
jgi:hypothetical protein